MLNENTKIYFNWSANALSPFDPVATDRYLRENLETIRQVARILLAAIGFEKPVKLYRGVVLRERVKQLDPHPNFTYLSFSESPKVAHHFADTSENGFPSLHYLGDYGYVVEYEAQPEEILFHHRFFNLLPYERAFQEAGIGGDLRWQQEVIILQPDKPLVNILSADEFALRKLKQNG